MGIGLACARELSREGARVVLAARGRERLEEAASALRAVLKGAEIRIVSGDVTDEQDVNDIFDAAETLGGVNGVVHAAGVLGAIGPVVTVEPAEWFRVVRVNLFGAFLVARTACQRMIQRGTGGSIVLFSGGGATSGFANYTGYACSKVAVVRLVESLATEVAPHGIRVNCVAPGFVATRMHDETLRAGERAGKDYLQRTRAELEAGGVPASLAARAVAFLLSARADGITGKLLAAPWDRWEQWPRHRRELEGSDLFTLRRIVPHDRGLDWQ
jgi:3-oxoacyl-[acyl-carrier protein] reductase